MLTTRSLFDDVFRDLEQTSNSVMEPNKQLGTAWHHMKMDLTELEDKYEVTADLPGVNKKDIDIKVDHNILKIHAERKQESEKKEGTSLVTEKRYGLIERNILLPETCDAGSANAAFENGVLTMQFPKKSIDKSGKRIAIK